MTAPTLTKKHRQHAKHIAGICTLLILPLSNSYAVDVPEKNVTIDIMVLYSSGAKKKAKGHIDTLINHKIAVTNKIYADSGLSITLRKVHSQEILTSDTETSRTILDRMTRHEAEFSNVPNLRSQYGADMVVMLRPYANDGICGLAWVGGNNTQGNMSHYKNLMYSHVSTTLCGNYVMAHELGHNMGLVHSRKQNPKGGTFTYSAGYGITGQFVTVMAYGSTFNTRNKFYKFASPDLDCDGTPCGISRDDPDFGANAVDALRVTTPQIAHYLESKKN